MSYPPHTIISLPVHTPVGIPLGSGALVVLVATQLFVLGLYLPPVFKPLGLVSFAPPQTIISVPVHTAAFPERPAGAPVVVMATQRSVLGLYLLPVFSSPCAPNPPQTIISVPVHTAV